MKFEDWFETTGLQPTKTHLNLTHLGWEAARIHILKLLKESTEEYEGWNQANSFQYVRNHVINDVENSEF